MENALLQGGSGGFKGTAKKEPQGKQDTESKKESSAKNTQGKKPFWKKTSQATEPQKPEEQGKGKKRQFPKKSLEEKKALMEAGKCFICEEKGHIQPSVQRNSQKKEHNNEPPKKKTMPTVELVLDMVADSTLH